MKANPCTLVFLLVLMSCSHPGGIVYTVPDSPWPESFGNHRAVLNVSRSSDVVRLELQWRRHDRLPEDKRFLIIEAKSGDTIKNICRYEVDNDHCKIAFGPVIRPGTYYFYYLPYGVQEGWGFYGKDYLKPERHPGDKWLKRAGIWGIEKSKDPIAKITGIQARTSFDSFYPMEIVATKKETGELISHSTGDFLLFPEGRENPVRMKDKLPLKWIRSGPSDKFSAKAFRNEYYAFQIGVFAPDRDIQNIKVEFSPLEGKRGKISPTAQTCFNTGGTDPYGKQFVKRVDIPKGMIQPLWVGIDIPPDIPPGLYKGIVTIRPGNAREQHVNVRLIIEDKVLNDRGDSETWRHSRLRWLNSTAGMDDEVVAPYSALQLKDKSIGCLGRRVILNDQGLPEMIESQGNSILSEPIRLVVETGSGISGIKNPDFKFTEQKNGIIKWESKAENSEFTFDCNGNMEFDGHLNFSYKLIPKHDITVRDIRMELQLKPAFSEYIIGMGLPGSFTPEMHVSKWKPTGDSFWIGNPEAGIHCEFVGGSYHGPLLNLYKPDPPASWNNGGKGGFKVVKINGKTTASAFSGLRVLKAGEPVLFEWNFLITPVKAINYKSQFVDRYFHDPLAVAPPEEDVKAGVKIINIHHANVYNPYINYPFIHTREMKDFIDDWHARGMKVKIYYTIRELTNHVTELWALRSLGTEILGDGPGGGYPWLREHLIDHYRPQWYQHFNDIPTDASMVNSGSVNRWYNYYIEGLGWLVKNIGIDGLYLDDVTYNRQILKRMRKVMENVKPGCIIDLHSNTGFSLGPANQYAEFFPFVDKLWFGESFDYNKMPAENWLVEASGIPFGLMGDMLEGGGNRWRGMIYGMTARDPWETEGIKCDPRPVWKIWDEFGIESSEMKGYWAKDCPVKTNNPRILATAYVKQGKTLISIASWSDKTERVKLQINWKAVGLNPQNAVLEAPEIKDFQHSGSYNVSDAISIRPGEGCLLYLMGSGK